jgi:gliding motility-associated-like protein
MKRIFFTLLLGLFLTGFSAYATHIIGYNLALINIKNPTTQAPTNQYIIRFEFFRDNSGAATMPNAFTFNIYKNVDNSAVITGINIPRVNAVGTLLQYEDEDCAPPVALQGIEYGLFETTVNLGSLIDPGGYYMSCLDGNRNAGIINTLGGAGASNGYGITYTMSFPRVANLTSTQYNSSPEYRKKPLTFFCVGKPYTIDWNVVDPDGDSLVYSMVQPLDDGTANKPFNTIPYDPGYNLFYNVADGAPDISVDAHTGIINFIPTREGKYVVAFRVEEYRNGIKIGEIRREFQMETVKCTDTPPKTETADSRSFNIVDTVYYGASDYYALFTSRDAPEDTLIMEYIQPYGDNLIGQGAHFSEPGQPGLKFEIKDVGAVRGEFKWKPDCNDIRTKPYKFNVVVHDQTCPSPYYDTTYVTLYIKANANNSPYFVSPDTITTEITKAYFIQPGEAFKLDGNTILKAIDTNLSQTVTIDDIPDPDDPSDFRNQYIFTTQPAQDSTTAVFEWTPTCDQIRPDTAYKIKFIAFDDFCPGLADTLTLNVEIFVIPAFNEPPVLSIINSNRPFIDDSVSVAESQLLEFTVRAIDTTNLDSNKFRNVTVGIFNNDVSSFIVNGGNPITWVDQAGMDSTRSVFKWTPACANVRKEPYTLRLFASDEGCPDSLYVYREIKIRVLGPVNTAPYFPTAPVGNTIQATVEAGNIFSYEVFAKDTNAVFKKISLDGSGEVFNPSIVENTADFDFLIQDDSVKSILTWETGCSDIRSQPYQIMIIASDNACGDPARDTLYIEVTVIQKPNAVPTLVADAEPTSIFIERSIIAGDQIDFPMTSTDTSLSDIISIDSVYTTIPQTMTKPTIEKKQGNQNVSTSLVWNTDCSNIGGPYFIKVNAWDNACRIIPDSSSIMYKITVAPNPEFKPETNLSDTIITLVAGEHYQYEIQSTHPDEIANDSIMITATGDIFANIPGEFATLNQKQISGIALADLIWNTSCDQIREEPYNITLYMTNALCQTIDTVEVSFMVVPNTDVTEELPNVFTPNQDGINELYSIREKYKVYCDPDFAFKIFNRWGKKVYETKDPQFEWTGEGMAAGTYFYVITSRAKTETGPLTLIK